MTALLPGLDKPLFEVKPARVADFDQAWELLHQYFEAVQVVVRDDKQAVMIYLRDAVSGIWIGYVEGKPAGCIALRTLTANTGEVKRLFVRPEFRRRGLALLLLNALETHAAAAGIRTLYLDTKDDLVEAITFYEAAGYSRCARYNDNPQATIFLEKRLTSAVEIRDFRAGDESAFCSLNEAWIAKLFKLEEKDYQTLRDPQKYILSKGGKIYMACRSGQAIGCCALLKLDNGSYEVAKMGVQESARGQGIGRALLNYLISDARKLGIKRLYLETNHVLENAIHLYEAVGFSRLKPDDIQPSPYVRADVYMEMMLS